MAWIKTGNIKGAPGAGLAVTTDPVHTGSVELVIYVSDTSPFAPGTYVSCSDGTNAVYGRVDQYFTNGLVLLTSGPDAATIVGSASDIPIGTIVTHAGPPGDKGDKGDDGPQGIQGAPGNKGDTGADGPAFLEKHRTHRTPATGDNTMMFYTNKPITITQLRASARGSSNYCDVTIKYGTSHTSGGTTLASGRATATSTGLNVTSFGSPSIAAGNYVWLEVGTVFRTNEVHVSLFGTYD